MKFVKQSVTNLSKIPVCDCHFHVTGKLRVDKAAEAFKEIMRYFNYEKAALDAIPSFDITENLKSLYIKDKMPDKTYVNAGIEHYFDQRDTADYYLEELKRYHAMGCDGIKLLEGKMDTRRLLRYPNIDNPVYDKFFGYAQQNNIPILMHLGDPPYFWDKDKMPQELVDKGWYCSPDEVGLEQMRSEAENMLNKFPELHIIFAHFYFLGDDLERAAKMMDKYPNLCFDLTPGGEMYLGFCKNPADTRKFFQKYKHRILYGTDTYCTTITPGSEELTHGGAFNLVRNFLENDGVFYINHPNYRFDVNDKPLTGINLDDETLECIYNKNFKRLFGSEPAKLDVEMIAAECAQITRERSLDELMTQNMQIMTDYFCKK